MIRIVRKVLFRGVLYSAGIVINRLIPEKLMRIRIFHVYELAPLVDEGDPPAEFVSPSRTNFQTRWCENEQDYHTARSLTHYEAAAGERVHSACLLSDGDTPIGALWRATDQFHERELGIRYDLAADQAWIFAASIVKEHRGRGAYRILLGRVLSPSEAGRRSEINHFASINPTNRVSMLAHRSSIKRTVGMCLAIRVFSLAFCVTKGELNASGHLSWNCDNAPIGIKFQ